MASWSTEPATEQHVLVLAPTPQDARLCHDIFEQDGHPVVTVAAIADFCAVLEQGPGVAILTDEAVPEGLAEVSEVLNRQPPWSDIPIVMLIRGGAETRTARAALEALSNVMLLERPVRIVTLVTTVRSCLRARQRQLQAQAHLFAREKAEEELARVSRLESVGKLAGGIAHDFNNILTVIEGNVSLAEAALPNEALVQKRLLAAESACGRAKDLTRRLLTFARGGAPLKLPIRPEQVLREFSELAVHGTKIECRFAVPQDLWIIEGDRPQIGQVVHNVVRNAAQAMQGRGVIDISAANAVLDDSSEVPLAAGRYVKVSIRDHGPGIHARDLEHIFDLFFTTRSDGTGLGLPTSHSIVRRHGGHLMVRSEVGTGSTFCFFLPAAPAGIEPSERPARHGFRGRVLVMDDDACVREVLSRSLELFGFEVAAAADGEEAVQKYASERAEGRPFDVVLLDLTVPGGMGGKEALIHLREIDHDVKAVVISAYSNDPVMADHERYGFRAAVEKPFRRDLLGRLVAELVGDPWDERPDDGSERRT